MPFPPLGCLGFLGQIGLFGKCSGRSSTNWEDSAAAVELVVLLAKDSAGRLCKPTDEGFLQCLLDDAVSYRFLSSSRKYPGLSSLLPLGVSILLASYYLN